MIKLKAALSKVAPEGKEEQEAARTRAKQTTVRDLL